jgi:hypothetical protein
MAEEVEFCTTEVMGRIDENVQTFIATSSFKTGNNVLNSNVRQLETIKHKLLL